MARSRLSLLVCLALLVTARGPSIARAAEVYFPSASPPATEITREFSLKDAARRGLIKLTPKGGISGDEVAVELQHKKVSGPVTVTIHIEFTVKPVVSKDVRVTLRRDIPSYESATQAELNRGGYKTESGDPIRFKVDYKFRNPEDTPRYNHHQILIVNPNVDLDQPDPNFRSSVAAVGVPNKDGASKSGTFSSLSLEQPGILAHELLHLTGLGDRYHDVYSVGGKEYTLPFPDPGTARLTQFAKQHNLPPPPAGRVVSRNNKGTARCDIMGTGSHQPCRKLSKRDLKIVDSLAGVSVVAQPGDLLLNKNASNQNYGVGFRTTVFAAPGSTTVARGISVYCLDHDRTIPLEGGFDVLGPADAVPGYESVAKLLALSGSLQPGLDDPPAGMQAAVWNITDAAPLATSGSEDEARALMHQAGVVEDSQPGGLADMNDPNAGSEDTAAVAQDSVLPSLPSRETKAPPTAAIVYAALSPSRLRAGRRVRSDLVVSVTGDIDRLSMVVQRRRGRRWQRLHTLPARNGRTGTNFFALLNLGRLDPARYRLVVGATKYRRTQATARIEFTVG